MFFFSRHKTTSRSPFILGANQENWGGIERIQMIRREDRDHRLATYTTLAEEALNALGKSRMLLNCQMDCMASQDKFNFQRRGC